MAAGEILLKAKAGMPHGAFGDWLEAKAGVPRRTAAVRLAGSPAVLTSIVISVSR